MSPNKMTNIVNLVIIKHENSGTAYLFKSPLCLLNAGDLVLVNTKRGFDIGTCMCNSFPMQLDSDEYKKVVKMMGATEPLSEIIGIYHLEKFYKE